MKLFVFRCRGQHQVYAASRYETGSDLPADRCAGGWDFVKLVNLTDSGTAGIDVRELGVDVRALRQGIKHQGWHLWESRRDVGEPAPKADPQAVSAIGPLAPLPTEAPPPAPPPAAPPGASPPTPAPRPAAAPPAPGQRRAVVAPPAPAAATVERPSVVTPGTAAAARQAAGHRVVWFDIPVRDLDRAMRFYSAVLGTPLKKEYAGPAAAIVVLPHADDTIGGCLVQSTDMEPGRSGPLLYLNAHGRLDAAVLAAQANGGTLLQPKHSIGPYGHRAIVLDSEGNRIALHSM